MIRKGRLEGGGSGTEEEEKASEAEKKGSFVRDARTTRSKNQHSKSQRE
jgi:hypothetical protein